ncbi:hypothetical protein [Actinokineospora globicatena]|uniref:hypothetical protein n=1 Tax=Actinokineospora globicatena TaxID=103729 RepID=UPI0020A47CFB|nr:hypothetical protein [Actinokineospora globicatena]MCP2305070.1 hypothetical protein [Actinokineospora globicatena]GLW80535.1 hypothetical protein Aglo01_50160 [Actinokineospora globicatena]GLW87363.1 hypothetical protein Aglo02_50020 [Actinokineospora globicatena]
MTKPDNERRLQTEDLLVDRDTDQNTGGTGRTDTGRDEVYRDGEVDRDPVTGTETNTDTTKTDSGYRDSGYHDSAYSDTGYGDRTDAPGGLTDPDRADLGHADIDRTDTDRTDSDSTHVGHAGADRVDIDTVGSDRVDEAGYAEPEYTEPEYTENAPTAAIPEQQSVRESGLPVATDAEEPAAQLFSEEEVGRFREQWQAIQTTFVDDPQDAVRGADHLVAEVMQALAATFTEHKRGLEEQWQGGSEAQTEDLRLALRRYRSFFHQLLHS